MTRRLSVRWPDKEALDGYPDRKIRILAVSDERERALEDPRTRAGLGRIDLVVGAGDLEPDYLSFLADAFVAPLVYVRGNHDHGGAWAAGDVVAPDPLPDATPQQENGLRIAGLSWPQRHGNEGQRDEKTAWLQAARLATKSINTRGAPLLVVSHAPPTGSGDVAADPFHAGFPAYDWLARRLKPPLWIHGHTPLAAGVDWASTSGPTTFVNVTGATLLELHA